MYDSALHNPAIFEHNMGARDFRVWISTKSSSRSRKEMPHQCIKFLLGANIYISSLFDSTFRSYRAYRIIRNATAENSPKYCRIARPEHFQRLHGTTRLGDGRNNWRSCKLQGKNRRIAALYRGLHLFVEIMPKRMTSYGALNVVVYVSSLTILIMPPPEYSLRLQHGNLTPSL